MIVDFNQRNFLYKLRHMDVTKEGNARINTAFKTISDISKKYIDYLTSIIEKNYRTFREPKLNCHHLMMSMNKNETITNYIERFRNKYVEDIRNGNLDKLHFVYTKEKIIL